MKKLILFLLHTRISYFAILFSLTISKNSFSQQLPFKTIGLKEGLPQSSIFRMRQDAQGYMWLATQGGLCRYDGTKFDIFSMYDGIGSQFIKDIVFDEKGQLWLATIDNGICCYDGKKFTNFNVSTGLLSNQIRYFLKTKTNDYFISSVDKGIIWIDQFLHQQVILTPEGEKVLFARGSIELENGNIWIGFNNGIIELDKKNKYAPHYVLKNQYEIICFYKDRKENIWAAGTKSLLEFRKDTMINWSYLLPDYCEVWDILEVPGTSSLHFGTTAGIMTKKETQTSWITTNNGLTTNDIRSLYIDKNENIWVGTQGGGAIILDNKGIDHFGGSSEVSGFASHTIVEDNQGLIWIGTNNQGLLVCDGLKTKKPANISYNDIQHPFTSTSDKKTGDIFFAEYEGKIIRIRNQKIIWSWTPNTNVPTRILTLCFLNNVLYVGTQSGVYFISEKENKLHKLEEFGDTYCSSLFSDNDEYLWVLSDGGKILKWKNSNPDGPIGRGSIEDFSSAINPSASEVLQGIYDPIRRLYWFCTYSGLIVWNGTDTYKLYSKNGIHSDGPWSITMDHEANIWIGLPNGVECIDVLNRSSQFIGYDQGFTPIETNSCSILCDKKGDIWFGTVTSATRIRVKDIKPKKSIVNLWIQHIEVNSSNFFDQNILVDSAEEIFLPYNQNNIDIDMVGICFDNAKDVKYSWCLVGFDKKWTTYSTQKKAIYSNLPPGAYEFNAKAIDANGFESSQIKLKIVITQPIWNRWWFYTAEILLMIFIIFLSFRFTSNPAQNKLGNVLTLVAILIIFEGVLIYVSDYVNKFTAGIPIFQLIMNVILAGTLHPLEQFIRKFMRKWALKKKREKLAEDKPKSTK